MAGKSYRGIRLVAVAVVLGWLILGLLASPYVGKLSTVATNATASFLPGDAEATRAQRLAAGFVAEPTTAAVVVYQRESGITDADRERAAADAEEFSRIQGVVNPIPPPVPSEDGQALQLTVPISEAASEDNSVVERIRQIAGNGGDGLNVAVGGTAGFLADLVDVFSAIDSRLLLVTLVVVLVILLIIYRSPVLWIVPLFSAGISYLIAAYLVYLFTSNGVIKLNGQAQGILTVLVFGAGTDYALLLIARYREELCRHVSSIDALRAAWRGAAPAILASGGTVIAGLLCLLLSSLESNEALGPVAALGIGATLLVMLTLLPALLLLGGRWIFWPRRPGSSNEAALGRFWRPVAETIARRARLIWALTTAALALCALGLIQLNPTSLGQNEIFNGRPESVVAQEIINRHFPAGLGSPAIIVATADRAGEVIEAARGVPGVAQVQPVTDQDVTGATDQQSPTPKVVDGRVQLQAILTDAADSEAAQETVKRLRDAVHAVPGADALVGGSTATDLDTISASTRDRNVIIPCVLAVILVILILLLRSLLAPLLLVATVVLSFLATLGLCALIFKYLADFAAVDASFPLFAFVFLIALGIDYNIFLMSRVREESLRHGTRTGVLRGLVATGGVITSAGIVLAATFSALVVLPLVVLIELGVAVALGVLLDTIIVRSLLVPALAHDIGPAIWWPRRPASERREAGGRHTRPD
jgi:RND superfamily putative drug exporter